ncbi:anti-sigma-28 factor, FlgM family [Desulfacinum infernum DSM 9756]|jgi:negative regulator of flagellin synthesis FlgM|uniref:Negative regulator of flagellin synthesis n=1 Tax=Desulfacinum infernum DSM 9756 TaxID=1121391 RepID=A0A1M5DBP8_9BACT|nr:flagellar biosynthesis anti-sigma factor FlgM [Desulfacinum infernum]MBC7357747.1 flagellar biosynthesis anti-sigma factor FlgM [Desulfacinum sp.]SHF64284.1 anti-sigma-28 factor, FlgM family [Desulfacinum infernum DSM 9756]
MDVKRLSAYVNSSNQAVEGSTFRSQEKPPVVTNKPDGLQVEDRVELSKEALEMAQAKKVVMDREEIRTERVDQLRQMVENGSYAVQADKIAAKMLDEIF